MAGKAFRLLHAIPDATFFLEMLIANEFLTTRNWWQAVEVSVCCFDVWKWNWVPNSVQALICMEYLVWCGVWNLMWTAEQVHSWKNWEAKSVNEYENSMKKGS